MSETESSRPDEGEIDTSLQNQAEGSTETNPESTSYEDALKKRVSQMDDSALVALTANEASTADFFNSRGQGHVASEGAVLAMEEFARRHPEIASTLSPEEREKVSKDLTRESEVLKSTADLIKDPHFPRAFAEMYRRSLERQSAPTSESSEPIGTRPLSESSSENQ
jgi:hypothetical protein